MSERPESAALTEVLRRAYREVFLLAGWLREGTVNSARFGELRAFAQRSLRDERARLLRGGLDEELVADAQLAAIALLDEAAQASPVRDLAEMWQRDTLQYAQYRHNNLGRDFFDRLDHWQRRPDAPLGLLELYAKILAWGFEGRYREENRLGDLRVLRETLQNDLLRRQGALPSLAPPLGDLARLPLPPPIVRAPWVVGMGAAVLLLLGLVLTFALHLRAGQVSRALQSPGTPTEAEPDRAAAQ